MLRCILNRISTYICTYLHIYTFQAPRNSGQQRRQLHFEGLGILLIFRTCILDSGRTLPANLMGEVTCPAKAVGQMATPNFPGDFSRDRKLQGSFNSEIQVNSDAAIILCNRPGKKYTVYCTLFQLM